MRTARDGLRWHLIEQAPGRYDWSSAAPMVRAAGQSGMQVIWDLCHYGWPSHIDIWSPAFPASFARFSREAALVIADVSGAAPLLCPVNEISFWSWAGGEVGRFGPCTTGRGAELKRQLVRAWIAAVDAVRSAIPDARFISAEPAIHIDPGGMATPEQFAAAEHNRLSQFEAIDLLTGRREPELGGHPGYLDILGINFYPDNQWYYGGLTIPLGHHAFRPFGQIVREWHGRYGRPILIAETGSEGTARASWLHYVCGEVREVMAQGLPVEGVCIYPILEYAGWENERICKTGLLSMPVAGVRHVYEPLAAELRVQRALLQDGTGDREVGPSPRLSEAA
ncbi:MAG: beta-glucosidase/6-phospho-beta-glucosidase/beta-galactosidase [Enterovirga sp.]|nr:beta-glucosidase/6-phospho-beta-glucosidase/beta-galactosidase [Enterovirga sp.]